MNWGFVEGMWTGIGLAYAGGILGGAYLWWWARKRRNR